MCTSIENWLQADPQNVAIVHCLTGKGRTATVLASVLCWLGGDLGQSGGTLSNVTPLQASVFGEEGRQGLRIASRGHSWDP
jgi:hypothetical protein